MLPKLHAGNEILVMPIVIWAEVMDRWMQKRSERDADEASVG